MSERVVSVIGAGNMRTAPAVFASIARWYPDVPFSVRLFDGNPERLELADLLLRTLCDRWNKEIVVFSGGDVGEALDGATDLILTLHEDCARRMVGPGNSANLDYFEEADEMDLYLGGDRNKPTPVAQLSDQTRRLLQAPDLVDARADVMRRAVRGVVSLTPDGCRVLSLMRGVAIDEGREVTQINWPGQRTVDELSLVPHQILRWVRGDELTDDLARLADESPVLTWLKEADRG